MSPPACAGCRTPIDAGGALCGACDARLPRVLPGLLPAARTLEACVAEAIYEGDVEDWIHRFKYPQPGLLGLEAGPGAVVEQLAVAASFRAPGALPELVLPVPLHPRRLRARGFNPAGLLARAVARQRGLPFDAVALRRIRDTPSQTGLDRLGRRSNVRGAFAIRRGFAPPPRVWLVDDVVTTGSTLAEAARALRRAGTKQVVAICAARTP